jgi:putative FmdB family regulatory protein
MPIYEYRCKKCTQRFELMRRLAQRDAPAPCPHCKSKATARVTIQRIAVMTGATPDAAAGEGEPEDFLGGGDHGHGHDHGMEDWDDDF